MTKAAVLTGVKNYEIREIDLPPLPDDGLLLDVIACGVCGSDLRRWREGPPEGFDNVVSGHEVAAVVAAVGKDLTGYKVGERLALAPDVHCGKCYFCQHGQYNLCENLKLVGISPDIPGGFAEQMILTGNVLRNGIVHRIPEGMSDLHATLSEPASSVLASHQKAGTTLGDTVVVLGGGPIGCLHIAVAKERGAKVILSEPTEVRRKIAVNFNPAAIIDPSAEDVVKRVKELTNGLGADIVICANPVAATQTQAVEMVRKGGRVVLFGGLPKANPMTSLDGNKIHYGEIKVVGAFSYHPTIHAQALQFFADRPELAEKLISHTFDLNQVNDAFSIAGSGNALKVVVMNR